MPFLDLKNILLSLPGIIIGLSFHEFAHAYVSDRLGDPTPRLQGRLTLSPLPHIDIIGFLLLILAGFGWAKPVQVNPSHYRNPRRDEMLVSVAGPTMNLLLAFAFGGIIRLHLTPFVFNLLYPLSKGFVYYSLENIFIFALRINIVLMLFNLLPIPPLDGFHLLSNILPLRNYRFIEFLARYGQILLLLLVITNMAGFIIGLPARAIYMGILRIFGF